MTDGLAAAGEMDDYVERARRRVLVTAAELLSGGGGPVTVLDVRRAPGGGRPGAAAPGERAPGPTFEDGHVPGAVVVDLDTELCAPAEAARGRRPLPDLEQARASVRAWGVTEGTPVVVYDDEGSRAAARAWWLLRWCGMAGVRILDGGLAAWVRAGGPLETGTTARGRPGELGAGATQGGRLPVMDAAEVAWWPLRGVLLDARSRARFSGEQEPVDARAGHIPGAVNAPAGECLDSAGAFLPVVELLERVQRLGVVRASYTAVYSGSGIAACLVIAALASVGQPAVLYPGSWSQWSADPQRPVATGP